VRENFYTVRRKVVIPEVYISCSRNIYMSAQILFSLPTNIVACAEILSVCAETYSPCAETYSLRAETYVLRGNIFKSPQIFCLCAEIIMSYAMIFGF
jgi:hypothetical protein